MLGETWRRIANFFRRDKFDPELDEEMQHKARRTNKIDFFLLPWAQEVWSSNLHAPTTIIVRICFRLQIAFFTKNFNVEIRQAGALKSQVG